MDVIAPNGRRALIETVRLVLETGDEVSPRGMRTKERRHLSVQIDDPYDVMCTGINANWSPEVYAAEAIQLIGGFSDPEFAVRHAPNLANFRNQAGDFDGAYGPRFAAVATHVVDRLRKDPDTRQAIVPIWHAADARREESRDYPCTLSLGFFIRRGRLELDVTMRSNDVNWGFKGDMFQFSQLQLSVADVLNIEAGPYRHTSFSMHLYERDWGWAEQLDELATDDHIENHPAGFKGHTVSMMMARAQDVARGNVPESPSASEVWYLNTLHGKS